MNQKENETKKNATTPCSPCALLLHEILSLPSSRPRTLLQSLLNTKSTEKTTTTETTATTTPTLNWRKTAEGVEVEIPVAGASNTSSNRTLLSRRNPRGLWNRLLPSESIESGESPSKDTIASSAEPSATLQLATSPSLQSQQQPATEWLQLSCKRCSNEGPEGNARAFVLGPHPLSVVLCTNRLVHTNSPSRLFQEVQEILTHELVHVHDVRNLHLDLRHCPTLAYSEVRAAAQAECLHHPPSSWYSPLQTSQSDCIKTKALIATQNLFPNKAKDCVQAVWEQAMADTRPFDNKKSSPVPETSSSDR